MERSRKQGCFRASAVLSFAMRRITTVLFALCLAGLPLSGCEQVKSANPLSPLIAGPIAGVDISTPGVVSPGQEAQVAVDQQPVVLIVNNAETNGVRPLSYVFQVANEPSFASPLFSQSGVAPGSSGQTRVVLTGTLTPGKYYWRANALDGANTGDFTAAIPFTVYTPVVIQAPTLVSPAQGALLTVLRPTLTIQNSTRTGPAGAITYAFEASTDAVFAGGKFATVGVPEGSGQTSYTLNTDLPTNTTIFWRVRAFDSGHTSPYSQIRQFQTPAPAAVTPPPSSGGGGGSPDDQLDLNNVTIQLGPRNIASWPVTSTVTGTSTNGGSLCINHTKLGKWPTTIFFGDPNTLLEGNQWVFAFIGGKWYGGAADWYRPGQGCKGVVASGIGADAFGMEPLHSWVPKQGETFGLMSSTPARAWPDMRTVDERTNVVLTKWQN